MNCFDDSGNMVERYQRLFTRPLDSICAQVDQTSLSIPNGVAPSIVSVNSTVAANSTVAINSTVAVNSTVASNTTTVENSTTTHSNLTLGNQTYQFNFTNPTGVNTTNSTNATTVVTTNSTSNMTMPVNTTTSVNSTVSNATVGGNMINCCDYFEKGAGYEFSVCDGIGAIIRPELIGGPQDISWASMSASSLDLSSVWTDLNSMIDNYCDSRSAPISNGTAPVVSVAQIW
jgi:hypothetical protein